MTVPDMGRPVQIETAIVRGHPDCVLKRRIPRSGHGVRRTTGKGCRARMQLDSTATAFAEHAHCPMVIVRSRGAPQADTVDRCRAK